MGKKCITFVLIINCEAESILQWHSCNHIGKTITQIQKKSSNLILESKLQLAATGVFITSGADLCSSVIAIATGVTTGFIKGTTGRV